MTMIDPCDNDGDWGWEAAPYAWACIADNAIRELWCDLYSGNKDAANCRLKENPNYNCPYRHIDIWQILQDTIPNKGEKDER